MITLDHTMSYSLYIGVDNNAVLKNKYVVQSYNQQNENRQDSGFDIYVPQNIAHSLDQKQISVNHEIKAVCTKMSNNIPVPVGYYMYPRSSISKTRYRMANSVGIIDSGYRGNLIAKLDILPVQEENGTIEQYTRLFQICSPDLSPFENVFVVNSSDYPFNTSTTRGEGGFGSTIG